MGDDSDRAGDDDVGGDDDYPELRASDYADRRPYGVVEVVEWIAEHLDLEDTKPREAPTAFAWTQLEWYRNHRKDFTALWKSTCANAKRLAVTENHDDGAELFALLDKLAKVRVGALERAAQAKAEARGG